MRIGLVPVRAGVGVTFPRGHRAPVEVTISAGTAANTRAICSACRCPSGVNGIDPGPLEGSPAFDSLSPCRISHTRITAASPYTRLLFEAYGTCLGTINDLARPKRI